MENSKLKIAFLGDSITQYADENDFGFIQLLRKNFDAHYIIKGVEGHRTWDLLRRLNNDIIKNKPNISFINGGINDIWWANVAIEEIIANLNKIYDELLKNNIMPIAISASVIQEDLSNNFNRKIDKLNEKIKLNSIDKKIPFVDVNSKMKKEIQRKTSNENLLTLDGIHLNEFGNKIFFDEIFSFLKQLP